jgi:hypothetical protein
MSSSSPPHPKKLFEYPLTVLNWSRDIAEAPPNMASYGNLYISVTKLKILSIVLSESILL